VLSPQPSFRGSAKTRRLSAANSIALWCHVTATSRDGTALLWDVPTQQPISRYGHIAADNAANACSLLAGPRPAWCPSSDDRMLCVSCVCVCGGACACFILLTSRPLTSNTEQESGSPVLLVAKEEGSMVGWDVRSKRELFKVHRLANSKLRPNISCAAHTHVMRGPV
jgi:hypothetical protein